MDSRNSGYLRKVCDYVHLNPVRASLLNSEEPLWHYTWSSYPAYLRSPRQRPPWLRVDRLLGEVGIPGDTKAGRQHFEKVMELARREDTRESVSELEQGWCLGDPEFRKELYPQIEARRRPSHSGPELRESASEAAEKRIQDALQQLGLSEEDLQARPKGDPVKVEIAHRLRTKTTMTLQWIATRLYMGTGHSLSNLLSRHRKQQAKAAMGRKKPSG